MKKIIALIITLALATNICCACGKKKDQKSDIRLETKMSESAEVTVVDATEPDFSAEEWAAMHPQEIQIRNICELATMEVYFHSVAKAVKPASSGVSGWGQAERRFWFEYSGYARIGIDMSRVEITITEDTVTILIPHASIIGGINIDSSSYSYDSVIIEPDNSNFYNSNSITASDVTAAVASANEATTEEISSDSALMMRAENRAVELIRKYIEQISEYSHVDYDFEWGYIDD
ncbi:MAG: DUF4230 domain-containing protein [Saccharofermentans sp.]|nr:DUF4230 domain-containing protein [Saccharofermentans sp.]